MQKKKKSIKILPLAEIVIIIIIISQKKPKQAEYLICEVVFLLFCFLCLGLEGNVSLVDDVIQMCFGKPA